MNKQLLITLLLALVVVFSISAVCASEINVTDSYSTTSDELISLDSDGSSQEVQESTVVDDTSDNVLESENSNILSTNSDEKSNVLTSDKNDSIANDTKIDPSKTITSKDVTKYYKGSTQYTATFLDNYGKALSNTNVKITVNGQSYTKKTDSAGRISMSINLKPGTYTVAATNPATGYTLKTTFKILSTITASDISKVYTDSKKFKAKFLNSNGQALAKKTIKFKIDGKKYKVKTNAKGVAKLSLKTLKKGTYKITSYNTDGLKIVNTVKVVKSTSTTLTASDYTFLTSDSKVIQVKLLNKFGYAPGKGKQIKFKIDGKTYKSNTNSKGIAQLKLPSLKAGIYNVKYKFAKTSFYAASSTKSKVTVIPSKTPTFTVISTTTFGKGAGTQFKVALKSGTVPLASKQVTLTLNGVSYTKTTDANGMVSLPINLDIGKYTIKYTNKAEAKINSISKSTEITVKERTPSKISWASATSFNQGTNSLKVTLVNSENKAISGQTVKLTVNSKTYTATTSGGSATFNVNLVPGNYTVNYNFGGSNDYTGCSGSTKISVIKTPTISIKNIIAGATSLKNYYANNNKVPSTVTTGGITFTTPEFLYLMGRAIEELGNSKTNDIPIIYGVTAPSSPSGDDINANLYKNDFVKLATNVANFISTNKQAPAYGSSAVGKVIYSELVDSFSRILAFYHGNNNKLPNYVTIKYGSSTPSGSQSGTGLNEDNTVKDLSIYLKSTTNCQVGNAAIKKVVDSVTNRLTTASAKATAIYNYVRDHISYSFYYNTKYGAAGTLSSGTGNCVDQAHLLVAMFRTADLPARYVHGTCKFSSGSTYGHVWAQVLIDGKWTVADPTSSRNSLGSIANWNTKSFSLNGIYAGISF